MINTISIFNKSIGDSQPCFFLAEIGNNHNGDLKLAMKLIQASKDAGADGVKFQTFKAEDIVSPNISPDAYPGWDVSKKYDRWIDFVKTLELHYKFYDELIDFTHSLDMAFVSTPASFEALQFLLSKNIDGLKVASMDLNNIPLLEKISKSPVPIILSTGMSTYEEIFSSHQILRDVSNIILHCVSNYPTKLEDSNLQNILMLKELFDVPIGLSSHSLDTDIDFAAIAMGACLVEKHVTLDREDKRMAEHHISLEPHELKNLIKRIRKYELALGKKDRVFSEQESLNRSLSRRSITIKRNINKNEVIRKKDIALIRPGTGIEPQYYNDVINKKAKRNIEAFTPLLWEDIKITNDQGKTAGKSTHKSNGKVSHNGQNVINCVTCGFWHVHPSPSKEQLDEYYQSIYYQDAEEHGDMKDKNDDPDGYYRLKYEDKLYNIDSLLNSDQPRTLLDIGSGYGEFLEFFQEKSWQVWGVEPAKHCIDQGRGEKCNIIQGDFESLSELNLPKVSVITINTVLEHVPDPIKLLKFVKDELMNEQTILHVEIPNDFSLLQDCVNHVCSPKKYWVCPLGHLNYWSHETFINLCKRLGFNIEYIESTFPLELMAMLGDDYISDPKKGRPMHLKRVDLEKRFFTAKAQELKLSLYKKFAQVGLGREILIYMRK